MKILALNSGGYDSLVMITLLESLGHEVDSMFFNYGQRSIEQEVLAVASQATCGLWKGEIIYRHVPIDTTEEHYVPSRNLIFISHALAFAELHEEYDAIAVGFHKMKNYFSDNSPQFLCTMQELAGNVEIELLAPLMYATKEQVYELGKKLGVETKYTWSCDFPTVRGEECGKCDKCDDAHKYL